MKPELLIMMRFQYVMHSQVSKGWEYEQICDYIYREERLKQRFWLFENICLPSLRAQKDRGFRLVMLSSPEMPDWAKERLFALLEPFEADVIWDRGRNWEKAFQNYIDVNFAGNEKPILTMRLDDDDAISINWVRELREIGEELRDVVDSCGSLSIYTSRGVLLDSHNEIAPISAVWSRSPTVGLSRLVKAGVRGHAYSFEHSHASENGYTFSSPMPYSYIRVFHQSNISRAGHSADMAAFRSLDIKPDIVIDRMQKNFNFDLECLNDWPEYEDAYIRV